jgi:hypothetical protein
MLQNDSTNGYQLARDHERIYKDQTAKEKERERRTKSHLGERTGTIHRPTDDDEADVILRPIREL